MGQPRDYPHGAGRWQFALNKHLSGEMRPDPVFGVTQIATAHHLGRLDRCTPLAKTESEPSRH